MAKSLELKNAGAIGPRFSTMTVLHDHASYDEGGYPIPDNNLPSAAFIRLDGDASNSVSIVLHPAQVDVLIDFLQQFRTSPKREPLHEMIKVR